MKTHSLRLGFATNSSSTHSIIIVNNKKTKLQSFLPDANDNYGWENFTLVDKDDKEKYLSSMLYLSLIDSVGKDIATTVAESWAGSSDCVNIDHQSQIRFPLKFNSKSINKEFFNAFKEFLLSDNVAILGGNDNDEAHPALNESGIIDTNFMGLDFANTTCRKDNDYWTLFNKNNGTKIRISFNKPVGFTPKKSITPELVDVKITDYCPFACSYCYQGSTKNGLHVDLNVISNLAYCLGKLEVFEVALGGGEPTMHPEFVDILKVFNRYGVVPNFTTRSTAWITDDNLRNEILSNAGSFAFSVNNGKEATKVLKLCLGKNIPTSIWAGRGLVFHYVIGTGTFDDFKSIVDIANNGDVPLTLLGYKTNGRGASATQHDNSDWLNYLMSLGPHMRPTIGIDTKLANDFEKELAKHNIQDSLFTLEEGKFSMYIDAVNGIVGPSSYCDKKDMTMIKFTDGDDAQTLRRYFNKISKL